MHSITRTLAALALLSLAHCRQPAAPATTATTPANTAASSPSNSAAAPSTAAPSNAADTAPVSVIAGQSVHPDQWEARCKANQRCAAVPTIPQCVQTESPRSFDSAWNDHLALVGQRITVRGHLVASGGCTEMGCPDRACCNHCFGQVVLAGSNGRGSTSNAFHFVAGEPRESRFACTGDDSAMCCGFAADGREVVVTATLTSASGAYVLSDAQFCNP